ncbi:alpha/beta hydrolase [Sphingomonas crocodyli]|uniref:Alpha/beta hydrolase n=1 Tax=Sphingomonas crocodyli TaxID=1979270 RepID=A0A437LWG8_9SPHN|nr:alpha/beta hydrolase [Sphingomonas crocodyli]RVT89716.1 alpha/beta hydrolase [Sphingomonas crocodyli]
MTLDPAIKALLEATPRTPSIIGADIPAYRAAINAATAAAPRYDVPLASVADRTIDLPGRSIGIRIYTPQGDGPFPIVAYYHGGGFVIGDLEVADAICRAIASGTGAVLVSVDYRLAPEHPFPAANDDAWDALNWIVDHAADLNGDPARIAVAGDSAGANISASMTLRARAAGLPLAAQVLMYGAPAYPDLTLPSFNEHANGPLITRDEAIYYWGHYLPDPADRTNPDAAAAHATSHAGLPPAFVASGECDPTRDTGEAYADLLAAAGVPTVKRRYAGMPHGFFSWVPYVPSVRTAMGELCEWLLGKLERVKGIEPSS